MNQLDNVSIIKTDTDKFGIKKFFLIIFTCLVLGFSSIDARSAVPADAVNADGITKALCNITILISGSWGKGIATVAIVSVGIGLFMGKLSWGVAFAVALGIGLVFGAGALVNILGSTNADVCTDMKSETIQIGSGGGN